MLETFAQTAERVNFEAHGAQKPEFTRPTSGTGLHGVNEDFEHHATKKLSRAGVCAKVSVNLCHY